MSWISNNTANSGMAEKATFGLLAPREDVKLEMKIERSLAARKIVATL